MVVGKSCEVCAQGLIPLHLISLLFPSKAKKIPADFLKIQSKCLIYNFIRLIMSSKQARFKMFKFVGSQFSDFSNLRKNLNIWQYTNWMHVPIFQMVSKPKIRGCSNWKQRIVRCPTSDTVRLQMGINSSCIQHKALDTLVSGAWGACHPVRTQRTQLQISCLGQVQLGQCKF